MFDDFQNKEYKFPPPEMLAGENLSKSSIIIVFQQKVKITFHKAATAYDECTFHFKQNIAKHQLHVCPGEY